jgi:large subunit ribosomal protein L29
MTDIAKVREMSDKELDDALKQAKQDLWSARFALSTRQLNDTSSIPQTRRTIARILTVQRERGVGRGAAAGATGAAAAAGNGKGA